VKDGLQPSDFVFESELDLPLSVSGCLSPVTFGLPTRLFQAKKFPAQKILAILNELKYKNYFCENGYEHVLHGCGLPSIAMHD
jgi:hypothetical protein